MLGMSGPTRTLTRMRTQLRRRTVSREDGQRSRLVIDPRRARWLPYWDGVTVVALAFTALVTPYEVAFIPPGEAVLFTVNRVVDCAFLIDLVLQFFLAYPTASDSRTGESTRWVVDHGEVARHYLKGWFALDASTTFISVFDLVSFVQARSGNDTSSLSKLKAFRVLRILRLVKLLRLLRGMALLKRWETRVSVDYGMLSIISAGFGVVLCSHWSACVWAVQAGFADDLGATWLVDKGYCVQDAAASSAVLTSKYTGGTPYDEPGTYSCLPSFNLYSASLYFAIMTITSIGYGDISATPHSASEQLVACFIMLGGGFMWSRVVGKFVAGLSSAEGESFKVTFTALNGYIYDNALPPEMAQRLRDYFHRTRHLWHTSNTFQVLKRLTPKMQGTVLRHVNQVWLDKISWLAKEDSDFIAAVVLGLHPAVFAPGETVDNSALFVLSSGVAMFGGNMLRRASVWGEDMLLASSALRNRTIARAITYVEVFYIGRDELLRIAQLHSETWVRLRRRILYLALQRFVVLVASAMQKLHQIQLLKSANAQRASCKSSLWKKAVSRTSNAHAQFHSKMGTRIANLAKMSREQRVQAARERELNEIVFRLTTQKMQGRRPSVDRVECGADQTNDCKSHPNDVQLANDCSDTPTINGGGSSPRTEAQELRPGTNSCTLRMCGNGNQTTSQAKLVSTPQQKRRPNHALRQGIAVAAATASTSGIHTRGAEARLTRLEGSIGELKKSVEQAALERKATVEGIESLRAMLSSHLMQSGTETSGTPSGKVTSDLTA